MPNNTSCHLEIVGKEKSISEVLNKHFVESNDCKVISLNSIIPMPEELRESSEGSVRYHGLNLMNNTPSGRAYVLEMAGLEDQESIRHGDLLAIALDVCPDVFFEGLSAVRCLETYGAKSWYDWAIENWGTKWDAYDGDIVLKKAEDGESQLFASFCTAWSPASPCIAELARLYPDLSITHHFLDEGGGFAGSEEYADGMLISEAEHDWRHFAEKEFGFEFEDEEEEE